MPTIGSGVGAGHVLVLMTIFSGRIRPPRAAVDVTATNDDCAIDTLLK